ncbi:superoxide dismutase [Mn], mitochondrial [Hyposmocoma kahamanoa]|uniref:superoxide dismutase [Mn], mitochondrial n=1 Tax=Hyposmocoma kahamanoa TaxID=1477025 RepID=UPI000E6D70C2|nr:superoxide dismutase [Mn], mitochondrial [Hyposmocoma kahamanoa]
MFSTGPIRNLIRVTTACRQAHTLPDLPYGYDALEPIISRDIMILHHSKHHATYVNNLNVAEKKLVSAQSKGDVDTIINLGPAIKFNGGGHINHTIFWQNLSPNGGVPDELFTNAVQNAFCNMETMKSKLSAAAVGVQGSGWAWLGYNKDTQSLQIATCANQDPLQATTGLVPLLGIDVWEHAYYLQYKNVRADYVKAIFDIVNWADVCRRYQEVDCQK